MFDKLVNKLGADKIMHFLAGGWISSMLTHVLILQEGQGLSNMQLFLSPTLGLICVLFIAVMKELADREFSWKDILATVLGAITIYVATSMGVLLNIL